MAFAITSEKKLLVTKLWHSFWHPANHRGPWFGWSVFVLWQNRWVCTHLNTPVLFSINWGSIPQPPIYSSTGLYNSYHSKTILSAVLQVVLISSEAAWLFGEEAQVTEMEILQLLLESTSLFSVIFEETADFISSSRTAIQPPAIIRSLPLALWEQIILVFQCSGNHDS